MPAAAPPLLRPAVVLAILAALTLARLAVNALVDPLPLSGDEAQYWLYGEHPAGGYYSKPPLLPWLMRLATELFGASHWAMRLPSLLLHPLIALVLFFLGRALFDRTAGLAAALLYLTLPAVSVSSLIASTDPPMMLGWALASLALVHALRTGHGGWWLLVGAAVGIGFLGKYTILAWLAAAALVLLLDPHWRKGVQARGLGLALLGFLVTASPNLLWNAQNGFPTFRHLGENADLASEAPVPLTERASELGDFLATQVGVFGPIAFAILLWLLVRPATWKSPAMRLVLALGLPLFLAICAQAWLNRANANWAAPAYLGFAVAVAAWLAAGIRRRLLWATVGLNLAVAALVVVVATLHRDEPSPWSRSQDPFRKLRGVDQVTALAAPVLAANPDAWLVMGDRMLMSNVLEGTGFPLERAVMWNPDGRINNHFELVTAFPEDPDATYVIVAKGRPPTSIAARFAEVTPVVEATIETHSDQRFAVHVLVARGFEGYGGADEVTAAPPG